MATQASAFRADSRFVPRLDRAVLAALMTEDFVPDGGSLFAGVLSLPRGFHLEVRGTDLTRVRHADDRDLCCGRLTGRAYLDRLAAAIEELAGEAFTGDRLVTVPEP